MRPALIALVAVLAGLAAGAGSASAQFNNRYCSEGGDDQSSGDMDCSFYTMEQCRATARGIGRSCIENPQLQWQARERREKQNGPRNRRRQHGD